MFVREVWHDRRLVGIGKTLRDRDVPTTRGTGVLGGAAPDFTSMTRGLFDKKS